MRLCWVWCSVLFVALLRCSEPDSGDKASSQDVLTGIDGTDGTTGTDGTAGGDADSSSPVQFAHPDYFPAKDEKADSALALDGLSQPVRVVYDKRGIPHIYGKTLGDLAQAQGYVVAQMRLFQMHTLRMAGSGRLAELLGASSLKGDVLLRVLTLRTTAEKMADRLQKEFPEQALVFQRFTDGVNQWIDEVNSGKVPKPDEAVLFGTTFQPWTLTDSMTVVRLQTWDLGFGNATDDAELMLLARHLQDTWGDTKLKGIEDDIINFEPAAKTPTLAVGAQKPMKSDALQSLEKLLKQPFYRQISTATLKKLVKASREMNTIPHHVFRSDDWGSNNWIIHGDHTATGKPLLANDPHLALRNPSIFYHIHLSNVSAGGDFEVNGLNFAGVPGIVLGNNRYGAWGATVFYSDVTDVYQETLTADGKSVKFNDEHVAIEERQEVFEFVDPGDGCETAVTDWLKELKPKMEVVDGYQCRLTLTLQAVPHHGPVIPWSYSTDDQGKPTFMTWKWTGFEPTTEGAAIWLLNQSKSLEDFKFALDHFDVGAQNWIWADKEGNIAWYPSHQIPLREHIEKGDFSKPPFYPMPGTGGYEWKGYLERSKIPQVVNPKSGYLVTANADPTGVSYDNNPFNDGPYIGYVWAQGFRMERAEERVAQLVKKGKVTAKHMKDVQADHKSPMGARVVPHLLAAIKAAESGDAPRAKKYIDEQLKAARVLLADWSFDAANGVGAKDGSDEAKDAAATAIYNVFQSYLFANTFDDEAAGESIESALLVRLLMRMLEKPDVLKTYDKSYADTLIWDDQTTKKIMETKTEIMVKSLSQALEFLADETKTGPSQNGGFGTKDMTKWRWGNLHTLTLRHNLSRFNDIPHPETLPDGFPRHGDNFCVDASHPGIRGFNYTYSGGPAVRHVFELTDPVVRHASIPGGQHENAASPHYKDEMELYIKNLAPVVPWRMENVLSSKERVLDLVPPSAVFSDK